MGEIVNKVASSGIITLNLEDYYPSGDRVLIDIADQLWQGMVLREKDFRAWIDTHDFSIYKDKFVAITCSADAIVPFWTYMLLSAALRPFASKVVFGDLKELENVLFRDAIAGINSDDFRDARVVVKGCGDQPIPESAYVELTNKLVPVVKSLMYGEPCSTVPVFKKKNP